MGPEIASRIKAKLIPKRRQSSALSVASTATNGTTGTTATSATSHCRSQEDLSFKSSSSPSPLASTGDDRRNKSRKRRSLLSSHRSSNRSDHTSGSVISSSSGGGGGRRLSGHQSSLSTGKSRNASTSDNSHNYLADTDPNREKHARHAEKKENLVNKEGRRDGGDENRPPGNTARLTKKVKKSSPQPRVVSAVPALGSTNQTGFSTSNLDNPSSQPPQHPPPQQQQQQLSPSTALSPSPTPSPNSFFTKQSPFLHSIDEDHTRAARRPATPHSHLAASDCDDSPKHPSRLQRVTTSASLTDPNPDREAVSQPIPSSAVGSGPAHVNPLVVLPATPSLSTPASGVVVRPQDPPRRQSILSNRHSAFIKTLLNPPASNDTDIDASTIGGDAKMTLRKIWVKRPHASPTLVTVNDEDLVDDVRDMILRKYANSLGKTFDAPDLVIRICPREEGQRERPLGPEECLGRTLDAYFPGGQNVEDALLIDIPRRTPKASPRAPPHPATTAALYYHTTDDGRPSEQGEGYFPPVHVPGVPSPHLPVNLSTAPNGTVPHSIAVLGTGHIPPIPSPGGGTRSRAYRDRPDRPRLGRTHTSSPNVVANGQPATVAAAATGHPHGHSSNHSLGHGIQPYGPRRSHSRTHSHSSDQAAGTIPTVVPPLPIPTSPAAEMNHTARVATPPPRVASPRSSSARPKKIRKHVENVAPSSGLLNGTVPPINVLIVEDNPINLKLLEAFVKRLKVRWSTAMNGRDAVTKWRTGGFHLVLMDIQLPVMSGLEATREIRRLERVNSIGVFSSTPGGLEETESRELKAGDKLENVNLFKSPVIVVALTASSLQSDRHEALAAGCNDFLTKPVNFVWLERKVMEWGCMQALIDFDGWRKWKDFGQTAQEEQEKKQTKVRTKKARSSLSSSTQ